MPRGETFALASAVCWAAAVILYRRSGETFGPFTLNLLKNVLSSLLLIPTLALLSGLQPPALSAQEWLICIISGLLGLAAADTAYFAALNRLGAGRTGVVGALYSPTMILLATVFLGERLGGWQILGFVLVLVGVLRVSLSRDLSITSAQLKSGLLYGLGAVVLMATSILMIKRILEQHDVIWIVQIRLVAGIAGMLLVMVAGRRTARVLRQLREPHRWGTLLAATFLGTYLSMLFWLAGYKYTLASIASVLNETASIFIVIFAWLFLGETLDRRKITGVAIAFSGVLLMVIQ